MQRQLKSIATQSTPTPTPTGLEPKDRQIDRCKEVLHIILLTIKFF